MKRNFLKGFLALAVTMAIVSCKEDNSGGGDKIDPPTPPAPTTMFVHKTLIEDMTGTWCQFCPNMTYAIERVKQNQQVGNQVIAVAVHRGVASYPDPMQISASTSLYNLYVQKGLTGFPFGLINRTTKWNQNPTAVVNSVKKDGVPIGIKIESNLTNTGGTVNASFKFGSGYEGLKYSIFVVENGVVTPQSPQQNSTNYYNGQGANFVHNDVLRGVSGNALGNNLENVTSGQEVVKANQNVSYTLFNNDLSKVEVIVFVTDKDGNVLNAQIAHANQTKDYEEKK